MGGITVKEVGPDTVRIDFAAIYDSEREAATACAAFDQAVQKAGLQVGGRIGGREGEIVAIVITAGMGDPRAYETGDALRAVLECSYRAALAERGAPQAPPEGKRYRVLPEG